MWPLPSHQKSTFLQREQNTEIKTFKYENPKGIGWGEERDWSFWGRVSLVPCPLVAGGLGSEAHTVSLQ